jgi:hypothetical protein
MIYGPGSTGWRERVVRRSLGWRWAGVVHERLVPDAPARVEEIPADVLRWVHRPTTETRDPGRNLRLLRGALKAGGRAGNNPIRARCSTSRARSFWTPFGAGISPR